MALESINPATGELMEAYSEWSPARTREVIAEVHNAWLGWRETAFAERTTRMRQAAEILRRNRDEYARIMAQEMGKPIADGRAEAEKCAWVCDYYAENAERFLAPEPAQSDGSKAYVAFRPLGTVLAVMPWNFPFWQVFRFAAPALMAGNTGVLKHSSNVPRCALAIEEVFTARGFPGKRLPYADDRLAAGRCGDRKRSGPGGHSDRQRCRRPPGGGQGRADAEKDGAGARRQRSLHRPCRCRPGRGGENRGQGPLHQFRAELYRRQALHRRRRDL